MHEKPPADRAPAAPERTSDELAWLRLLIDQIPAVVWTADRQLRVSSVAGSGLRRVRLPQSAIVGRTVEEIFGTGDPELPSVKAHRHALAGAASTVEFTWAGQVWRIAVEPLRDAGGAVVGVVGVGSNLTSERTTERALADSEANFQQMAAAIRDVFWLADGETGRLLYVSPAFESVWGRRGDALLADPGLFVQAVHPEDRDRVLAAAGDPAVTAQEYRIVRPDGAIRWIRDRRFAVCGPRGELRRWAGLSEDFTERKRLEEQLAQAQKMDALGRLAGGIAHDFNNALTVILSCARALATGGLVGQPQREAAELIVRSAEQTAALTRQLLLFGRKRPPERQPVDLNELVTRQLGMLGRIIREDVEIEAKLEPRLWQVVADPSHLEQMLVNLVVNARDALPAGGRIELSTANAVSPAGAGPDGRGEARFVVLTVRDTGVGIPPAVLPHIFEPFFTTKEAGVGTGLGLATVQGIVAQAGGRIEAASEPGAGARFTVWLPAVEAAVPPGPTDEAPEPPRGAETILVAEDNDAILRLLRSALASAGYEVLVARDGREAQAVAQGSWDRIDLLLTDLVMPRVGGLALVAAARRHRPGIKVVYMTGYAGEEPPPDDGAAVLYKPFDLATLLGLVRAALDAG
jgi:PAS domain S-box-containing protein